jgi:hypothetical protein
LSGEQILVGAETGDRAARGVALLFTEAGLPGRLHRDGGIARIGDEHARIAVLDDVGGFLAGEVPVDGRDVQADLGRGHIGLDPFQPVGQQQREMIAALHAQRAQRVGDPVHPRAQCAEAQGLSVRNDQPRPVGIGFGPLPKGIRTHRHPPVVGFPSS